MQTENKSQVDDKSMNNTWLSQKSEEHLYCSTLIYD